MKGGARGKTFFCNGSGLQLRSERYTDLLRHGGVPWHPGRGTRRVTRPSGCATDLPEGGPCWLNDGRAFVGPSDHHQVRERDLCPRPGQGTVRPCNYTFAASVTSSGANGMILCKKKFPPLAKHCQEPIPDCLIPPAAGSPPAHGGCAALPQQPCPFEFPEARESLPLSPE